MDKSSIWTSIGYFGVFYLVLAMVMAVIYPFMVVIAKPVMGSFLPISQHNSVIKTLVLFTLIYWVTIGIYIALKRRPPANP